MLNLFQHLVVTVDKILSYPKAFIGYLLLFCRTTKRWGFPITTLGNDKIYKALRQPLKQVQGNYTNDSALRILWFLLTAQKLIQKAGGKGYSSKGQAEYKAEMRGIWHKAGKQP